MGEVTVATRSIRSKGKVNRVPEAISDMQGLCGRSALRLGLGCFGLGGRRLPRNPPGLLLGSAEARILHSARDCISAMESAGWGQSVVRTAPLRPGGVQKDV